MNRKNIFIVMYLSIILLMACGSANNSTATSVTYPIPTIIPQTETAPSPIALEHLSIHTTQNNQSGNHLVGGSNDLKNAHTVNIALTGTPLWLGSAPFNGNVIIVAALDDGSLQAFKLSGQNFQQFDLLPNQLPTGMPPTLITFDNNIQVVTPPSDASSLTSLVMINEKLIYIEENGDLILNDLTSQTRLPINALLDSRILVDENNRLLILTEPTNRYDHGIAGDEFEASAIVLVEIEPEVRVVQTNTIENPDVIEGVSAIWADIDNDGTRDIIVTLSNSQTGSRIVAFQEDGTLLAESDPIGLGYRWRHQIAVAQFELNKPPLLVNVRTPHIGGIVEFLQYNNGKLESVQQIRGFSTHSIGSRNLDSAIAGDFNNDGTIELLVPDQSHMNLAIISLNGVLATLPLDGVLTSNLSATEIDGKLYIGAGTQGNLRIWIP